MESTRKPLNEDRVALLLGAVIFILAMLKFGNMDILGWAVKTGMWVGDPLTAWSSATKGYLSGVSALIATYVFLAAILAVGVKLMGANVKKFLTSFTIIFLHRHRLLHAGCERPHRGQRNPVGQIQHYLGHGPQH